MAPKKRVTSSTAGGVSVESAATATGGAVEVKKETTTSATSASASSSQSTSSSGFQIALAVWQSYINETSQRILLLDAFLLFLVAVGVVQFVYCVLIGNYVSSIERENPLQCHCSSR